MDDLSGLPLEVHCVEGKDRHQILVVVADAGIHSAASLSALADAG